MKYLIEVTREDIDSTTNFCSGRECAMAKALERSIPDFYQLVTDYLWLGSSGVGELTIPLPSEAAIWNIAVNNLGKLRGRSVTQKEKALIQPISFEIEIVRKSYEVYGGNGKFYFNIPYSGPCGPYDDPGRAEWDSNEAEARG